MPEQPEHKPLPDWKTFDPSKIKPDRSRGRDVTKEVLAGKRSFLGVTGVKAVQVIGGVRPPPSKPKPNLSDALTCIDKGSEWMNLSEYARALDCFERAVDTLAQLPEEWPQLKAGALHGKAKALSRLKRDEEAIHCLDEAIALEQQERNDAGETDLPVDHAGTIMDKGLALTNAGRRDEGAACYQTALAAFRREWANGSLRAGALAALTLYNIGQAQKGPGASEEEIRRYDEALEIHQQLPADYVGAESKEAAIVLTAKSRALLVLGRFEEAVTAAQRAVEILEPLAVKKGREYLKLDLSLALLRQGKALESLHRAWDASRCFQRSTELVQKVKRGYTGDGVEEVISI